MVVSSMASPLCTCMFQTPRRKMMPNSSKCKNRGGFKSTMNHFESFEEFFGTDNRRFCIFGSLRTRRLISRASSSGICFFHIPEEVMAKKKPLTEQRRVVVTGLGVVTPLGHDPDILYNNLLEGVSGITEIEGFDCSQFPTRIAGEVKSFSVDEWVSPKISKRADKSMIYTLTAGKKAFADGGITEEVNRGLDRSKCGIIIGSALGGLKICTESVAALNVSYKKITPFCIPYVTTNIGSAILAMDLHMMLCGGSDAAVIPLVSNIGYTSGLGGFSACRTLSKRNYEPTKASSPWDTNRDGFVIGEGAGVLLLEELEHAKRRGATIYAEFLGGSFTCDAYHVTKPHPDGAGVALCIEKALEQSGVAREDVNYINAHAASTPTGDLKEYQALIRCFGMNPELKVNSTKSMIGHLLGAAGAVEAVATIKAIQTGLVHPNINLENPDEGVDTEVLVGSKKECLDIKVALSNSFGFGGQNSCILFAPYK
nr:3-oxoacyl-[acyl-carrier-protein] synthase II, chloroplastic-like isoform X7 [Ziziphus jujuba var. spinosa]